MSVLDKISKALRDALATKNSNDFMKQLQAEKRLYDLMKEAGLDPSVSDPRETASMKPEGVISKETVLTEVETLSAGYIARSDLACLLFSNTFAGAGDYQVLAAVAGQKHKVYAYNYEIDAAIQCYFKNDGGSGGFGIRKTVGMFAQTLINPYVTEENKRVLFHADGVVSVVGFIQYVTEA